MPSSKQDSHTFQRIQQQEHQELLKLWQEIRQTHHILDKQYFSKQITIEWLQKVYPQIGEEKGVSYENVVGEYLKEVHQLDEDNMSNVQFKFSEALELLNWHRKKQYMLNIENSNEQINEQTSNKYDQVDNEKKQQNKDAADKHEHFIQEQQKEQEESKIHQQEQQKHKQVPITPPQQQNTQNMEQNTEESNQFGMGIDQAKQMQQKENKEKAINKNYKDYIKLVFEHYCKMSYATGNDPTFQQIQHKSHIMTINKFMIFCKEFAVLKLNSINRAYLLELFRKNAELYKQMNFQQFVNVLIKISQTVYGEELKEQQPSQNTKQFEQLLLFLEVNNLYTFKKKMQSLNIAYRPKNSILQIKKPELKDYKFKFEAANGRTKQQVKQQILQRKKIRSQHKIKIAEKNKKIRESQPVHRKIDRLKTGTSDVKKKLAPPKPPVRRMATDNPLRNSTAQTREENQVTGYANVYRLKKNREASNMLRLNSIVEGAKKAIQSNHRINKNNDAYNYLVESKLRTEGRETPISDYYYNYQEKDNTNQSNSNKFSSYDIGSNGSRNLSSMGHTPYRYEAVESDRKQNMNVDGLGQLLGSDQEQDQYLNEHLYREKMNNLMRKQNI